jgi:cell wall-associated NlpC family hydrolase
MASRVHETKEDHQSWNPLMRPKQRRIVMRTVWSMMLVSVMTLSLGSVTANADTVSSSGKSQSGTVTSSRSFKKVASNADRRKILQESVSTTVEKDSNWGGLGDMQVQYSPSTDQKTANKSLQDAVNQGNDVYNSSNGLGSDATRSSLHDALQQAPALLANEKTTAADLDKATSSITSAITAVQTSVSSAQAAAVAQADALTASRTASASRSSTRSPSSPSTTSSSAPDLGTITLPNGHSGSDVVNYALQYVGKSPYVWGGTVPTGWDCSGFVMYVYAQFGISLPHFSGSQAAMGSNVSSIAEAQPGDIIANNQHAALYLGNGLVVNALNPRVGTVITPVNGAFHGSYSIRRIIN